MRSILNVTEIAVANPLLSRIAKYVILNVLISLYLKGSFIAILDNLASITIDDCKKCLIILGPCQGRLVFNKPNIQSIKCIHS
jgi:hypothetical protein